jgi:fatty acid desaturase
MTDKEQQQTEQDQSKLRTEPQELPGKEEKKISLQRQTYIVIGILLLIGLALGAWASKWWLLLPVVLSIGMLTAGVFGVCNMTRLLSWLPGNPKHSGDIS